jgi:hypothetical protein
MRRSVISWNNVTGVAVTTAGKARRIIVTTTSERSDHSNPCHNYDDCKKKQEDKTPSDCSKAFKPCPMHGPKSNHTFKECYKNPKNQDKRQAHNKKHQYEVHHNNTHYTSDDDGLHASVDMAVPSEDPASTSGKGKNHEDENYHLHFDKKLKSGSHVPCKSDHQQHRSKSKSCPKGKKGEASPTIMDDDLDFTDAVLMGFNSIDADFNRPDDITNLFDFSM